MNLGRTPARRVAGCGPFNHAHGPAFKFQYGDGIVFGFDVATNTPSLVGVGASASRQRLSENGLLPIALDNATVDRLFAMAQGEEALEIAVDLESQKLVVNGEEIAFDVDSFRKHCLLQGLDDIGLTLQHVDAIRAYEEKRKQTAPWLFR